MEELKSLLPSQLKQVISHSRMQDLEHTCDQLISSLRPHLPFQRVVRELTDPQFGLCKKDRDASLEFKRKGNDCFARGDNAQALRFYSQALRHAPASPEDADKTLLAILYTNRASSNLNLDLVEECKRDCSRAIILSPQYAKAWYRRGKANMKLKSFEEAVHDLKNALTVENSSSGNNQIKKDLDFAVEHSNNSSDHATNVGLSYPPVLQGESMPELQCENTVDKGRGMFSQKCLAPGTLVHSEEPLAAIILKTCRASHCHLCLTKLPGDVVFCSSCTIPVYCSEKCGEDATGNSEGNRNKFYEHQHECGGSNWSSVLPENVVLAGRLMAKIIHTRDFLDADRFSEEWDFVHHYEEMSPTIKLELHIFSVILSYCLSYHFGSLFPISGSSAARLVIIMAQMKVNSMAIVHMTGLEESINTYPVDKILLKDIEQVRVGQAIYSTGRLFNHSCQPNIHAYFFSRRLFLRTTEYVPAGSPLELSYGPQIGQWGFEERRRLLKNEYFFTCQCRSCSRICFSDLVINAFHCNNHYCRDAVPESWLERGNISNFLEKGEIDEAGQFLVARSGPNLGLTSCLNCGLVLNLKQLAAVAEKALRKIQRLKENPLEKDHVLEALSHLRSVRHAYSKDLAKAEDMASEMFCSGGDLKSAAEHCKASIKILEKLYHEKHIVIGNELVKLVSLQLSLGDGECAQESVDRLRDIFSLYYGPHAEQVNPYLTSSESTLRALSLKF